MGYNGEFDRGSEKAQRNAFQTRFCRKNGGRKIFNARQTGGILPFVFCGRFSQLPIAAPMMTRRFIYHRTHDKTGCLSLCSTIKNRVIYRRVP